MTGLPRPPGGGGLRYGERWFRAFVESIPHMVWVGRPDGANEYNNKQLEAYTGLTTDSLRGDGWMQVIHGDDLKTAVTVWRRAQATGEPFSFTERVRRHDGEYRWFLARGAPLRDGDGNVVRWIGTWSDVHDRVLAEEALRRNEERLRALADSIPQLAWTANPDGFITWYNRRWYEYTGTTPEQMEGWGWESVHDPTTLPDVLRRWKASIASGSAFEMEFPLRGADGKFRRFLTRAFPLEDEHGEVVQWFGTNTDVTELMEVQQALHDAARRKDEFISVLSHELRNPLAAIQTAQEVLEHAAAGTDQAARARAVIGRQVRQLARLVDDLMDATRITRGKVQLQPSRMDLGETIRHAVEDHRPMFAQRGISLELREPGGAVFVQGDAARLAQVAGNLLDNAAKFTNPGGHVLVVVERQGPEAVVAIQDDGVGIAPEMLPVLFQPFMQVEQTLARSLGGLGLGLTLVKGIAELHGGSVEARSEGPGTGSRFLVRLPLAPALAVPVHPPRLGPAPGPRRILVIEDNEDSAASLQDLLELEGHHVRVARDGQRGVDMATREKPDVVLCDVGLPVLDGYEVARRLRGGGHAATLIALTGYASPEDEERARSAGFDHHVTKPPDMRALLALVAGAPAHDSAP